MRVDAAVHAERPPLPAPPASPGAAAVPLCVDLDGTLLQTDSLHEGAARLLVRPHAWLPVARAALGGRAALKAAVAAQLPLDPARLPWNTALVEWLQAERAAGRRLVLATAAARAVADAAAAHLALFDEVIASDGTRNLRGHAKARALVARFGERGFDYAGNDRTDLPVWRHARAAVVVNASDRVARAAAARAPVARRLDDTRLATPRALLRAMRPHQWSKNLLVVVPLVTARATDPRDWLLAVAVFVAMSCTASAIYLLNDLTDLDDDRAHPRKRGRPFAAGALPLAVGVLAIPLLLGAGATLALGAGVLLLLATYAVTSLGYSLALKERPLVDVFCLAFLYTLRLYAGGEATDHHVSRWLLAFSIFFFLGLALVKRVAELQEVEASGRRRMGRRGYTPRDLPILRSFGTASGFTAVLVLALYVPTELARGAERGEALWAIVPLVLFWQCRIWLATTRHYMHDDPIVYAARDWVSRLVAVALAGVFLLEALVARGA